jgi:tetratricopeptide (TPR) repeat protein
VPDDQDAHSARQETDAGRDAFTSGRDQTINVYAAAAGPAAAPGLLPRDVPAFTGRAAELDQLTELGSGGSAVVTAIGGTAGVGKTALAIHAAYRLLPSFPDGHLHADLRGYTEGQPPAEPGEVLEVFLRRLGVPAAELPVGLEERSGLLRQLLASRRVLIVLDNVSAEDQVRPLLPGAGNSLVLITSRGVLAGLEVDQRIDLGVLPEDEATELLATLIGRDRAAAEPEAVRQIRHWCGSLPLALRISGQLLAAHPNWPVSRLAAMLADERARLDRLSAGDRQVRTAFAASYRQLAGHDQRLFRLLGLHPGPDLDAPAAASLADVDLATASASLDLLADAHLVIEDTSGRFTLHDLLRLFARQTCQDTDDQAARDAAQARLVGHYAELARHLDACLDPRLRPAEADAAARAGESLPSSRQALTMFEAEMPNLMAAFRLAVQQGSHQKVWEVAENMRDTLSLLRNLDDLLSVSEAALGAARTAENRAAEDRALNNLGLAYRELGRLEEAVSCYEQDLAICREAGDRIGEGATLVNLGNAYRALGRLEEALTCHLDALAICRETGDRIGEGKTLISLGNAYRALRRLEEAVTCHLDALAVCRETGDRANEGMTLSNLGVAYGELGRVEEAVTCHLDALAIRREAGDRYREGLSLDNLGSAYQELGQLDQAESYWQEAAQAMRDTGDHERAARYDQQAANVRSRSGQRGD